MGLISCPEKLSLRKREEVGAVQLEEKKSQREFHISLEALRNNVLKNRGCYLSVKSQNPKITPKPNKTTTPNQQKNSQKLHKIPHAN